MSVPIPTSTSTWTDGAPPTVAAATLRNDNRICKAMRCPGCGRRGLEFRPQQCEGRYRVRAVCPDCAAVEEF